MKTFKQVSIVWLFFMVLYSCGSSEKEKEKVSEKREPYDKGELASKFIDSLKPFYHGVASGDPTTQAVILWTKLTPEYLGYYKVKFEVATDSLFKHVVKSGVEGTDRRSDFIVKIDVTGLTPNTYYYYRFNALGKYSITGRTHTLPENPEEVKLIFASCSNYAWGYFNAYDAMAKEKVDAIVHLGDYIYEYGIDKYGSKKIKREHVPANETVSLRDYRLRYSQYRLEPGLMRAHQMHPFITIWDDHELANNAYVEGAQNHQPEEGEWMLRKRDAVQTYYEWLPVRSFNPDRLYRSFDFGNLVKLVMIDNRTAGRTVQATSSKDTAFMNANRTLLGKEQFDWSVKELASGHTWKIIGNPVLFGDLKIPGWGNNDYYMDGWDGYPVEKQAWCEAIAKTNSKNVLFITGDFHSSLYLQAGWTKSGKSLRPWNEFVVPSISSSNYDEENPMDTVLMAEKEYRQLNKNLDYVNLHDHGYVVVHLRADSAFVDFMYVSTVLSPTYTPVRGPHYSLKLQK